MRSYRKLIPAALLAFAFPFATAGVAWAGECEVQTATGTVNGKTLEGEIKKVNKKQMIVRQYGEQIKFEPFDGAVVSGLKADYAKLKKGDWVVVCSKLLAKPRLAYSIEVIPTPDDGAVEE